MRPLAYSALAAAAMLAASDAQAQIAKSGSGYLLRVKYVKGQTLKYKSINTMSNPTQPTAPGMVVEMPVTMNILDVKAGKATTKATVGPVTMGGSELRPAESVTMTLDTRNQASNAKTAQMMGAQFPPGTVKVGQTWNTTAPIPSMSGGNSSMKAVYKFQGLKAVNGKSMAVITYSLSGGATGSGTLLFLASDGTLYSNNAKLSIAGGGSKMTVTSKMTRV